MRRRPPNTKPWLVQVKRKSGGRIQNLLKLMQHKAKLAQLRAEPISAPVLNGIAHTSDNIARYRRWANRQPPRAWINGGAHYSYCMECGSRHKINDMVTRARVDMANQENYCVPCAQAKSISFWSPCLSIDIYNDFDFHLW